MGFKPSVRSFPQQRSVLKIIQPDVGTLDRFIESLELVHRHFVVLNRGFTAELQLGYSVAQLNVFVVDGANFAHFDVFIVQQTPKTVLQGLQLGIHFMGGTLTQISGTGAQVEAAKGLLAFGHEVLEGIVLEIGKDAEKLLLVRPLGRELCPRYPGNS